MTAGRPIVKPQEAGGFTPPAPPVEYLTKEKARQRHGND